MTFPNVSAGVGSLIALQSLNLRQGDRLPSFVTQVVDEFDTPIPLTGMTAWLGLRRIQSGDGAGIWDAPRQVTIFDDVEGILTYDWQESDTLNATPGTYEVVVECRDSITGEIQFTTPTRRDTHVIVTSKPEFLA